MGSTPARSSSKTTTVHLRGAETDALAKGVAHVDEFRLDDGKGASDPRLSRSRLIEAMGNFGDNRSFIETRISPIVAAVKGTLRLTQWREERAYELDVE